MNWGSRLEAEGDGDEDEPHEAANGFHLVSDKRFIRYKEASTKFPAYISKNLHKFHLRHKMYYYPDEAYGATEKLWMELFQYEMEYNN